jgi:hypothetical protein
MQFKHINVPNINFKTPRKGFPWNTVLTAGGGLGGYLAIWLSGSLAIWIFSKGTGLPSDVIKLYGAQRDC